MTDIAERLRLRRDPLTDGERAEAADQIERLREALQSSCDEQRQLFRDEANFPCEAAIENEVLRGLLRDLGVCVDWYIVSDNLKRRIREALGDVPDA